MSKKPIRFAYMILVGAGVGLLLGFLMLIAFSVMEASMLGPESSRLPNLVHFLLIVPAMVIMLDVAANLPSFGFTPILAS